MNGHLDQTPGMKEDCQEEQMIQHLHIGCYSFLAESAFSLLGVPPADPVSGGECKVQHTHIGPEREFKIHLSTVLVFAHDRKPF